MRHRPFTYTNKPRAIAKKTDTWTLKIVLAIIVFLLLNNLFLLAEGTSSIAPSEKDAAALFIGAGNTGAAGGDYGKFAWKGSSSKLFFNIQSTCEKAYFGFSAPNRDRSLSERNQNNGGTNIDRDIIFRIIDPNGRPINDLACFGNLVINGEVWQSLRQSDANLTNRTMTDNGPSQLAAGGYDAFELDLSACGLTLTGNYSIEFYTRNNYYDPDTPTAGFYIEYFDVTVANCSNRAVKGRLWSNNWGLGIKKDGDGPFDRAFNGAFFICSKEGFITKIDFNTGTNNRAAAGKNNDQQSGFRAGSFNVSFNTSGPGRTGDIAIDRQSVFAQNSPNPELPVFLNVPDPSFCPPQGIGDFKAKNEFMTGCPRDYCLNVAFSKPGQIEILIENSGGNRLQDHPSEVRIVRKITEANRVARPEDPNFPYELCLPWDGNDGYGNLMDLSNAFISGFYFQGIYHFPVYDAEFNDDGFTVSTVRPNLGVQKLFYDDTQIPSDNFTGESKDGTNGCPSPCHRWSGEYRDFIQDFSQVFGNFNTINTWWFGNSAFKDFSFQVAPKPTLICPPNYVGCVGDDIQPNTIGSARISTSNPECTVIEYADRILARNEGCQGTLFMERQWSVFLQGLENDPAVCYQLITLEDKVAPELVGIPLDETVNCGSIPAPVTTVRATDDCQPLSALTIAFDEEKINGKCGGNYQLKRTWTATDPCGNRSSASQLITVVDEVAPVLVGIPADMTTNCTNIPHPPQNISATDNCEDQGHISIAFAEEKILGACAGDYTINRTWTATDLCGNTTLALQSITVLDQTPPVLANIPDDLTVSCDAIPTAATNVTASDNCESKDDLAITFAEKIMGGTCTGSYTIERTWTATDRCGNSADQTQIISVEDTTSPILANIPADLTASCDAIPPVADGISATDNCSPESELNISMTEIKTEGACTGNYTLTRTWNATDPCGNQSQQSQIITILDTDAPKLLNIPEDIKVSCDVIPAASDEVTATDNCATEAVLSITFMEEKIEGACAGNYTLKRTWTATDDCGNESNATQTITVEDTEGPVLANVPHDVTVECNAVPSPPEVTATDNCELTEAITIIFKELRIDGDCGGNYTLRRAWTATDACGNVSLSEQTITVEDKTAPVFTSCPTDIVVFTEKDCQSAVLDLRIPNATDNCDATPQTSSSVDLRQPFPLGTTSVIFTATDDCGNKTTCRFFVKVENAPQDQCPDDLTILADCVEGKQTAAVAWTPPNGNECCSACPASTDIQGFIFLGAWGGHRYYQSKKSETWLSASSISDQLGGYLVSINDPAENTFLLPSLLNFPVHIGLTDDGDPNDFYWQNDAELIYENWREGALTGDTETTQFGQLLADGTWDVGDGSDLAPFILEIPCVDVFQIAGPLNGSAFPVGTTRISYLIEYDQCSNADTCSFDVSVDPCELTLTNDYCSTRAVDTTCFWIDGITLGNQLNRSGPDGGYGDFTQFSTDLYKDFPQKMVLTPSFAPGHTFNVFWKIWIDFDQSNYFDPTELIFSTKTYLPVDLQFTIPTTAKFGSTRMRVAMSFADVDDPCAELAFGEVEDYVINIMQSNDNINGQPTDWQINTNTTFALLENELQPRPVAGFTPMDLVAARQRSFTLFPNPVRGQLTLQINGKSVSNRSNNGLEVVRIFDRLGQVVLERQIEVAFSSTIELEVEHLEDGLYFVELGDKGRYISKKKFLKLD